MKQSPQLPKQVVIIKAPVAQTGNQPTINPHEAIIRELLRHREERETELITVLSQGDASSALVVEVISTALASNEGSAATLSRGPDLSAAIDEAYETVDEQISACDTLVVIVTDSEFALLLTNAIDRNYFCNIRTSPRSINDNQAYFLVGEEFSII
ncbi:MAG: hypothetical protein HGA33_05850 [Candidatus Moranbacteria bacterium]|nr:hypothetical protein [Candidatus Moranbacteria bacterium]